MLQYTRIAENHEKMPDVHFLEITSRVPKSDVGSQLRVPEPNHKKMLKFNG